MHLGSLPRAVIVTSHCSPDRGGVQAWSDGLKAEAERVGYQVGILGIRDGKLSKVLGGPVSIWRADRIVCASWKYFLVILPLLRLRCVFCQQPRILLLFHGLELGDLRPRVLRILNKAVKDLPVRLIANSEFTLSRARESGLNGDWERQAPCISLPELNVCNERTASRQIVTVTRLFERKNLFRAIDAIVALNREGANLDYHIIGEGPLREMVSAYAEKYGGGRVHMLGPVEEPAKWQWLQSAVVFLLPSVDCANNLDFEGYGLALIEANWAGVPVVAGPSGGMPEAVLTGYTGYVSDGTSADIARNIRKLIDDPLPVDPIRAWARLHRAGADDCDTRFFERGASRRCRQAG